MSTSHLPWSQAAAPRDVGGGQLCRRGRARRRHRARPPARARWPRLLPLRARCRHRHRQRRAARRSDLGADVTGLDLVPSLLDIARRARATVDVHWVEGDAEALPFGDATFDRVLSVFGVQFAPHHEVVADELVRVCRPGGTIGLVNWTPEGLIGRLFKILGAYSPTPPAGASPPPLWGSEEHVRVAVRRLSTSCFERGVNPFVLPERRRVHDVLRGALRADAEGEGAAARPTGAGTRAAPRCARCTRR